jgi:uncharacterized protein (TIGR00297 family)
VIERAAAGIALAAVIAMAARAGRMLTTDGAIVAAIVGAASVAAGWSWGALLLVFFLSSSALSRIGIDIKERRTAGVLNKGDQRDAVQVLANGGVFAAAALGYVGFPSDAWMALAGGALAAATADTWATEIGTLTTGVPRLITTWQPAPPGTSGAVTMAGTSGMVLGSAVLTLVMATAVWPRHVFVAAFVGGVLGALADSVAGATIQARRRCASCAALTERAIHSCGAHTVHAGGVSWMTNDAVNLLCSVVGAASALVVARALE